MKRFHILSTFFVFALAFAATGCAPDDSAPATEGDSTAVAGEQAGFDFQGDFDGPLGLQLYSLRQQLQEDVSGTLARIRDMGFQEVELAGTYGMTPEAFRQELDRAGLNPTAMHIGYNLFRDSLESVLDQAEALGVQYVGTASIPYPRGERFTVDMARQTAADFNRWGEAASARGLTFYYHTHGFEFQPGDDGVVPFDVLMEETDPENVKYEMDVFWVALPGVDPAALLRKYPDRWELMHVKDMAQGTPLNDHRGGSPAETKVPVGTGQIDYRAVLQAAEEIGLDHYYIEDESTDPPGNIPLSTAWLETVQYDEQASQ